MIQKDDLLNMGFTNNESEIYLILLKLKEAKAYDITKYTSISRSHVYDSLNSLLGKGIINYVIRNKKRIYKITGPEILLYTLEEKEEQLLRQKDVLRKNIESYKIYESLSPTSVETYEGIEGVKYILNDIIRDGQNKKYKEILVMNSFSESEFTKLVPKYVWDRFWNLRRETKIKSRQLFSEGKKITYNSQISSRILDKRYFNNTVMQSVYGDKIIFFIFKVRPIIIRIINAEIAELYKKQFEILWDSAQQIKEKNKNE